MSGSNPFSTRYVRPGALPFVFPPGADASLLVDRLRRNGWWGQIVGRHGSGKSTLLHTLVPSLSELGRRVEWISLHQGERPPSRPPLPRVWDADTQLVIDGYEQLGWLARRRWRQACRRCRAGLLVTVHQDAGLPDLWRTDTSPDLAQELARRLLAAAIPGRVREEDVAEAYAWCGGDLRETFFRLYDRYESSPARENRTVSEPG